MEVNTKFLSGVCNYDYKRLENDSIIRKRSHVCYGSISYDGKLPSYLRVYHNPSRMDKDWVDWCLNCPQFGEVFPCKDVDKQIKEGFEVDTTKRKDLVWYALFTLRTQMEYNLTVQPLLNKGYSIEEIYIICNYLKFDKRGNIVRKTKLGHSGFSFDWKSFKFNKRNKVVGRVTELFFKKKIPLFDEGGVVYDKLFNTSYRKPNEKSISEQLENFIKEYRECVD